MALDIYAICNPYNRNYLSQIPANSEPKGLCCISPNSTIRPTAVYFFPNPLISFYLEFDI